MIQKHSSETARQGGFVFVITFSQEIPQMQTYFPGWGNILQTCAL